MTTNDTPTATPTAMADRFKAAAEMTDYDRYKLLVESMIKATVHYRVTDYPDIDAQAVADNLSAVCDLLIVANNWVWQLPDDNRIVVELRKVIANAKPITP